MSGFSVHVVDVGELKELDGSWKTSDYVAILEKLDVDGAAQLPADDAREMCILAIQDLEPAGAASVVLDYKLGDVLTPGQIKNYGIDSQHEKLWEQSADMELHHAMFDVSSLLATVNDSVFPTPDAVQVTLDIKGQDTAAMTVFHEALDHALLVRMLATGMDENAILNRLFGDDIAEGKFSDADSIIWVYDTESIDDKTVRLKITSSGYWLDPLRETESFDWDACLAEH